LTQHNLRNVIHKEQALEQTSSPKQKEDTTKLHIAMVAALWSWILLMLYLACWYWESLVTKYKTSYNAFHLIHPPNAHTMAKAAQDFQDGSEYHNKYASLHHKHSKNYKTFHDLRGRETKQLSYDRRLDFLKKKELHGEFDEQDTPIDIADTNALKIVDRKTRAQSQKDASDDKVSVYGVPEDNNGSSSSSSGNNGLGGDPATGNTTGAYDDAYDNEAYDAEAYDNEAYDAEAYNPPAGNNNAATGNDDAATGDSNAQNGNNNNSGTDREPLLG